MTPGQLDRIISEVAARPDEEPKSAPAEQKAPGLTNAERAEAAEIAQDFRAGRLGYADQSRYTSSRSSGSDPDGAIKDYRLLRQAQEKAMYGAAW